MSDLERKAVFLQISETLDTIDEIVEDSEVDTEGDEQFSEIVDLLSQVRSIVESEE